MGEAGLQCRVCPVWRFDGRMLRGLSRASRRTHGREDWSVKENRMTAHPEGKFYTTPPHVFHLGNFTGKLVNVYILKFFPIFSVENA